MIRLRNKVTGVHANVDEELAAKLGSEWVAPSEAAPARRRSRRAAPDNDDAQGD